MKKLLFTGLVFGGVSAWAQPGPVPAGANKACDAQAGTDTLPFIPDSEGFSSLFDGTSTKGWWESCKSGHSGGDNVLGGIWLVDPGLKAIFSAQKTGGAGSLFMTNQKFSNYELVFDLWPDFGNDGGIFNRSTPEGKAYQTTLDYIGGSSVGGSFAEGIKERGTTGQGWNTDPYTYGANESTVRVQTDNSWTVLTKDNNPTSYGCGANGCLASDWTNVWDVNGWNQMRIKFFSGLTETTDAHMQVWIRDLRAPNKPWVPMLDQTKKVTLAPNHIAFQIHVGTARWSGAAGNFYRNIKWQPLDDTGKRLTPVGVKSPAPHAAKPAYRISANSSTLSGVSETDFAITMRDVAGNVLERFSGKSGEFSYPFTSRAGGLMIVEFKTPRGTYHQSVTRLP